MQFRTFWTWSKLLNNRAESGQRGGGGVQNPVDTQRAEWGLSFDDVPHTFVFSWTYELPFAKNARGVLRAVASGWTLNGILRYESGRPLNINMTNDLAGLLFNAEKRPHRVADAAALAEHEKFDPNAIQAGGAGRYFNPGAWTDPGALQFGNAPSRDGTARGFKNYVEDVSLFKVTPLTERVSLRIETQAGNVTNRVKFCDPNTSWTSGAFGTTALQCNQPRSVQFGAKLEF
jgi:hypothetical protein